MYLDEQSWRKRVGQGITAMPKHYIIGRTRGHEHTTKLSASRKETRVKQATADRRCRLVIDVFVKRGREEPPFIIAHEDKGSIYKGACR